ncbi:uncharacterized protein LOC128326201 isoform X3 [Hemicordylus capensis]|uniref:uncharacterized protein LOC128326201 isoform X3 n=1 Tax=Hemicordylus capensis TaxID=884348 RepID=UPI00230391B9|nr:uncharacterized protein LOC128326201 isoform X3 [Hemicordylus capensis]
MGPKKAPVKKAPVKKGGKAPAKKGGKPTRPPKRPNAPAESSSDDEGDLELGAIRAFIARLQALERQRTTLEGDEAGGGPSGVPPHAKKSNRAEKKAKLMQGFADRLAALEAAAGTAHEEPAGITTQPADSGPGDGRDDNDAALPEAGTWSRQGARAGPQSAGPRAAGQRARVLILGHSFIFWARKWAQSADPGTQLGLGRWATVEWLGRRGMRRAQFLPMLHEFLEGNPVPDVLLLHFGGNDLVDQSGISLSRQIAQDLVVALSWCPGLVVIWSDITQRRVWRGAVKQNKVDRARRGVNAAMARFIASKGGGCIPHNDIAFSLPQLFRGDGVHLSPLGMRYFLDDLRLGLATVLLGLWGGGASS